MRTLYSFLWYLIVPFLTARLVILSFKHAGYLDRIWQRFGFIPKFVSDELVWIHAVSVGEVVATKKIVESIQAAYPGYKIVISTGTPTGADAVVRLFGDSVMHLYQPYDIAMVVRRYLALLNPKILLIMETELWPNLLHYCRRKHIPAILINARMSQRSARRYQRFSGITQSMLNDITKIAAQTESDAKRLISLGANPERIMVTGSIKFDMDIDSNFRALAEQIKSTELTDRKVWIAASTHSGEEQIAIEVHKELLKTIPGCLLVLAPRHPVRSAELRELLDSYSVRYQLRSTEERIKTSSQVLLVDTMGELSMFYGIADVAFVGGSLVTHGGHNPIEPACFSIPILFGPHDFNFLEIDKELINHQAAIRVKSGSELLASLSQLFSDTQKAKILGNNAHQFIDGKKGSSKKIWNIIEGFMD